MICPQCHKLNGKEISFDEVLTFDEKSVIIKSSAERLLIDAIINGNCLCKDCVLTRMEKNGKKPSISSVRQTICKVNVTIEELGLVIVMTRGNVYLLKL